MGLSRHTRGYTHQQAIPATMKTELKKNASMVEYSAQKKPNHLTSSVSTPPNLQLKVTSNPSASKAVRSSLLKSMEIICVTPSTPPVSPLQQSFLGNIYRDMVITVEEGADEERNTED